MKNLLGLLTLMVTTSLTGQLSQEGFNNGSQSFTDSTYSDWYNPENSITKDSVTTMCYLNSGRLSSGLIVKDFNFNIPEGFTISGVEVSLNKFSSDLPPGTPVVSGGWIEDWAVNLTMDGLYPEGSNHALNSSWLETDSSYVYGDSTDLWGVLLTDLIINSSDFGVYIMAKKKGPGWKVANIDEVVVKVYYNDLSDELLPVELYSFNCNEFNNKIDIRWVTVSEVNNSHFILEHSTDIKNWYTIATVYGRGNTTEMSEYHYKHLNPSDGENYYRLKQIDFDGTVNIYGVIGYQINTVKREVKEIIYYNLLGNRVTQQHNGVVMKYIYYKDGSIETEKVFNLGI